MVKKITSSKKKEVKTKTVKRGHHNFAPVPLITHPIIGVLTGISYVSGIDYYKGINEQYGHKKGTVHIMP